MLRGADGTNCHFVHGNRLQSKDLECKANLLLAFGMNVIVDDVKIFYEY